MTTDTEKGLVNSGLEREGVVQVKLGSRKTIEKQWGGVCMHVHVLVVLLFGKICTFKILHNSYAKQKKSANIIF